MVTIIDPLLLSLCPEIAFAQFMGGLYPLPVLFVGSSYRHLISVWVWEAVPRGCIHVWVIHITPGQFWVRRSWILSTLQTSTYQTNGSTGGAGRTGRFSPSMFRAGPGSSFQNQFRNVLVTPGRAGFNPYLNLWGADMGPLGVMMVKWTTWRVVLLSLWGNG